MTPASMLYPTDGNAFDVLARFIEHEYVDPADMEMRGMLATLGIEKGNPFNPDQHLRDLLDQGAKTAFRIGHMDGYERYALYYKDRHWRNVLPANAKRIYGPTQAFYDQTWKPGDIEKIN